jgi:hypothetical protein
MTAIELWRAAPLSALLFNTQRPEPVGANNNQAKFEELPGRRIQAV